MVFYRFHSKKALQRSMEKRDTARNALYKARIKLGMDPTGPGFNEDSYSKAEEGFGGQFASEVPVDTNNTDTTKKFALQAPPLGKAGKGSPKVGNSGTPVTSAAPGEKSFGSVPIPGSYEETTAPAAPGEPQYGAVPLPGEYSHDQHLEPHVSEEGHFNQPQPEHMQAYDPNAEHNFYGRAV